MQNWVIVRTYTEFVNCITKYGVPKLGIAWDHDLNDADYAEYHRAHSSDKTINYNNIKERTGYHCAQFLAEHCISNNIPIPEYYVHSMNYMGKQNIISVLESAKKVLDK
jgi:hypothetical protein